MQALTPEQSKMFWNAAGEAAKWAVSGITLAFLGWIGRAVKNLPAKITEPVVKRLDAHEKMDADRFGVIEAHLHIKHHRAAQSGD